MNLSGLTNYTTAATSLSNLVLVNPQKEIGYQPQSPNGAQVKQPPALLFHYEGEQTVALETDITDHYIEDNTAIQDQMALKPEVVTTHGFIGELNNIRPGPLGTFSSIANKLSVIDNYVPGLSTTAINRVNQASALYSVGANVANSAVSAWSSLTGSGGLNTINADGLGDAFDAASGSVANSQTKQQVMFQQFYGYWRARTLFTVQTPWAIFQNMAIKTLRAIQDPDTRVITDFEVTFKMIRTAKTSVSSLANTALNFQGRSQAQASGVTNLGTQTPTSSISLGTGLTQMGVA